MVINQFEAGVYMKFKVALCMIFTFSLVFCGPSGKKTKDDVVEGYDYKKALQNYQIGCNYLNDQDLVSAVKYLKMAVEMEPENYRFNHWLGVAFSLNGRIDDGIASLNRALQLNPESTESYNYLATIYTELGKYAEAEEYIKIVLADEAYPQPDFAYFNLGILKQKEGKLLEAVAAFNKCVKENPKFYRAYYTLGNLYEQDLNYEAALHFFSKAEPGYLDDYTLYFKIGKMNYKLKRYSEAKRYLSQVTILFPPPAIDKATQDILTAINKHGY